MRLQPARSLRGKRLKMPSRKPLPKSAINPPQDCSNRQYDNHSSMVRSPRADLRPRRLYYGPCIKASAIAHAAWRCSQWERVQPVGFNEGGGPPMIGQGLATSPSSLCRRKYSCCGVIVSAVLPCGISRIADATIKDISISPANITSFNIGSHYRVLSRENPAVGPILPDSNSVCDRRHTKGRYGPLGSSSK